MSTDDRYDTAWRRSAAAIYAPPRDGKVFGAYDIDVTTALEYMQAKRAEGWHLTVTHLVVAAIGRTLGKHVPALNCYSRLGRVYHRGEVVVAATVSLRGEDITIIKIGEADKKGLRQIAEEMDERIQQRRAGSEERGVESRGGLARLPWPLRKWTFQLFRWLVHEAGLKIPGAGISSEMFGSVLVTNIGSLGLAYGFPALIPASNLSFVVSMGKIQERPMGVNGQIVLRQMLPFGATFDHRIVDGAHIGRLVHYINHYLTHPEELEQP
jgi:pyruvate/2-oxoglutarate dehydrogenase complex dihydrolipoamide acyltransferase (E2) component